MPMNSLPAHEPTLSPEQDRVLDRALQKSLRAPPLPDGFRSGLLSAALRDTASDLESRKRALELEYAQALQRMQRGHVRLQRDTLALILVIAFTAGACANLALPWLENVLAIDPAVTLSVLALLIGLEAGASVWLHRFARPGWLFGADR